MVAGRLPLDHLRAREGDACAIDAADWTALGETGVFALTLPEPAGTGLAMAEAVVVFEELGRALIPGPLVGTFLAATRRHGRGHLRGARPGRRALPSAGAGPVLVEHLGSSTRCSSSGRGRGPATLLPRVAASGATRVETPLDPLTPLWRLDTLPGRPAGTR